MKKIIKTNLGLRRFAICFLLIIISYSCNNDEEIIRLLSSEDTTEIIKGANMAAESGDPKYVPLLVKNAYDYSTSTHYKYKGISVYSSKIRALKIILNTSPTVAITDEPDSTVVAFYHKVAVSRGLIE